MNLNFLIFPAPKPKYTTNSFKGELIWVPKNSTINNENENDSNVNTTTSSNKKSQPDNNFNPNLQQKSQKPVHRRFISYDQNSKNNVSQVQYQLAENRQCINTPYCYDSQKSQHNLDRQVPLSSNQNLNLSTQIYQDIEEFSQSNPSKEFGVDDSDTAPQKILNYLSSDFQQSNSFHLQDIKNKNNLSNDKKELGYEIPNQNFQNLYGYRQIKKSTPQVSINNSYILNNDHISLNNSNKNQNSLSNHCSQNQALQFNINNTNNLKIGQLQLQANVKEQVKNFSKVKNQVPQLKKKQTDDSIYQKYIPCLYLRAKTPRKYIMLYFHGNGEDLNLSYEMLNLIRTMMNINVLCPEYPGYGIYKGQCNEELLLKESLIIYKFIIKQIGYKEENVILIGRSIGSGPATYLASFNKVNSLVLLSPFTSIRGIIKDLMGNLVKYLIKERFENINMIKNVKSPVLIIHGQQDKLIPFEQSKQLLKNSGAYCQLVVPKNMSHTQLNFQLDFINPVMNFLKRLNLYSIAADKSEMNFDFPIVQSVFFETPAM